MPFKPEEPPKEEPIEEPGWLLIDGHNMMYRAFYAMPSLTHSDGSPVGAILGTCNMLMKVALPYLRRGAKVIFCADSPEKTWRSQLDPQYKATRSKMPADLKEQIEETKTAVAAFGAAILTVPGHEADDIIATLALRHAEDGVDVWSSDKDLLQLLEFPGIRVLDKDGVASTADDVFRAFGVAPAQIGDYLALVGDKSDNIKGIPGIGPKSAAKLLTTFGTLDRVLKDGPTSDIAGAAKRKLLANADKDLIALARRLVTLDTDVPIPNSLDDHECIFDWDRLTDIADRYELLQFKTRIRRERNKPP